MNIPARISRSAAVAILALSLAAPATAQTPDLNQVRIDNFAQVNAGYFRGAQPEKRDYADLAALGVKTVINLTSDDAEEDEKALVEANGMRYLQIPMTTRKPPTAAELGSFLAVVNDAASQPVYVHCVGGRHRTGVMTAVYRMTRDGLTGEQAYEEMKQYKYGPGFLHPEFKSFVKEFDTNALLAASSSSQQ